MKNRSDMLDELEKNPTLLIKLSAPILLTLSFLLVFVWWILLEKDVHRQAPIVQTLAVPLILFGTTAIINIMLFVQANPITKFLAVFFIGAIFSTSEVTTAATRFLAPDYAQENRGSTASDFYESEGVITAETNSTIKSK